MNNIQISCNIDQSLSTHYLIYKIINNINNINNKYYIGQHITNNISDNYMGSGKYISRAESKYSLSSFSKIILFDYDNFDDMNNKEKELVQLSNCYPYDPMSYNLKEGGNDGLLTEFSQQIKTQHCKETWKNKSEEELNIHRQKISNASSGKNNGMFGKGYLISGDNNGMFGVHRYGKDSPMFGKRGEKSPNFGSKRTQEQKLRMSIAAKNRGPSELRNNALSKQRKNTKHMYDPISHVGKFVKIDEIQYYQQLGWKLGKYKNK